ncbi:hypothetical protein JCM5353_003999 [Sporobolomyces roseus]
MSSGGLSAHFSPDSAIPVDYLYLLSQVTLAAGCVNYFIFISSFFLLILPNTWALSVVWSINQRVTIRRKMASTADDASLGKRLAVVGWRNRVGGGGIESQDEGGEGDSRNDPSRWRGDEFSSVAHDDRSSHRHTFKFHKTLEPDYQSFDLDTGALDALQPSSHVRETQVSGIWVITETKIETSTIT